MSLKQVLNITREIESFKHKSLLSIEIKKMKTNLKLKYLFHILILITLFLNQINYCNGVKLKGVTISVSFKS